MSDWLCIDDDSPDLDALVDEQTTRIVAAVAEMLDEFGVGADDPARARMLESAAQKGEDLIRKRIADARSYPGDEPRVLQ
jgi:hypothetical protein